MMSGCGDIDIIIMARNESTNQLPAFSRKSPEPDGMLIRSEGHLGEFSSKMKAI